jgi:PAS domain S-box-containing protein
MMQQAARLEEQTVELEAQQQATRETEAWFRGIIESAPDGMLVTNEEGRIILANPQVETNFGYEPGKLVGNFIEVLVPEASRGKHVGLREGKARGKGQARRELRGVTKDGREFPIEVSLSMLPAVGGHGVCVCASARDISERKQQELELRKSEMRLNLAAESGGLAIWEWNIVADATIANPMYKKVFGFDPAVEPVTATWHERMHPEDKAATFASLQAHLAGEAPAYHSEFRFFHPEAGEYVWLDSQAQVTERAPDGAPLTVIGITNDITGRKAAQKAVAESERRLDLALRGTNTGLWDWSAATGELVTNETWSTMLGYDRAELDERYGNVYARWEQLTHPEDLEQALVHLQDHIDGRAHEYRAEFRMRSKSGDWKWILDVGQGVEFDEAGKPVRFIGTHVDIDERKRQESAIKQSETRLKLAAENGGIAIWEWNVATDVTITNSMYTRIYGFDQASEANSDTWQARLHLEDRERLNQAMTDHLSGKTDRFQAEFRFFRPDRNDYVC